MKKIAMIGLLALATTGCRMPDMIGIVPNYGVQDGFANSGLDHHSYGVGLNLTWDLNPGRYTRPADPGPDLKNLFLNGEGKYWVQECLENLEHPPKDETEEECDDPRSEWLD